GRTRAKLGQRFTRLPMVKIADDIAEIKDDALNRHTVFGTEPSGKRKIRKRGERGCVSAPSVGTTNTRGVHATPLAKKWSISLRQANPSTRLERRPRSFHKLLPKALGRECLSSGK